MTDIDIQERIEYLNRKIDELYREINSYRERIAEMEDGCEETTSIGRKWEGRIGDCYDSVRNGVRGLHPNSQFADYYLDKINEILSGREVYEISDCISRMKTDFRNGVFQLEDDIEKNKATIYRYETEIRDLMYARNRIGE